MLPLTNAQIDELIKGSQKELNGLWKPFAVRVQDLIVACAQQGYGFGLNMGLRTPQTQAALFAQGRMPLSDVNNLRKVAGLGPISPAANKQQVTKLKFSWHNLSVAGDLVQDGDLNKAGIQWSWKDTKSYVVIGGQSKKVGLEWGGFWQSFVDLPHVQLTGGLDLKAAINIYNHAGIIGVQEEVSRRLKLQGWVFPVGF